MRSPVFWHQDQVTYWIDGTVEEVLISTLYTFQVRLTSGRVVKAQTDNLQATRQAQGNNLCINTDRDHTQRSHGQLTHRRTELNRLRKIAHQRIPYPPIEQHLRRLIRARSRPTDHKLDTNSNLDDSCRIYKIVKLYLRELNIIKEVDRATL